ncbi:hypothetical protein Moror_7545 [Moniliophthora roreri MCA 2997]|uniref:Uncharacterized protein n=1 Tax=Moniliophthora roreri (strain MCA 2997) TaxID=1381753 RepID=V2WQQ8_MONRO|nr:hypothetical protein Moror_7545 [Moniliophthora roreri MCA 2997]
MPDLILKQLPLHTLLGYYLHTSFAGIDTPCQKDGLGIKGFTLMLTDETLKTSSLFTQVLSLISTTNPIFILLKAQDLRVYLHSNELGELTAASSSGYHDSRTVCDGPYAASYGFMSSSESKSHDYMNPATGPSFPYRRLHHNSLTPQRPSAPQFSDAYIPAGAAWPPSDSGYRYNDTYPLSVTDSVDNVPELDGQPRVIKQVVATVASTDALTSRHVRLRLP